MPLLAVKITLKNDFFFFSKNILKIFARVWELPFDNAN